MKLSLHETQDLKRKHARRNDLPNWLFRFFGLRMEFSRRQTAEVQKVKPGDATAELGCRAGFNFSCIERFVGSEGKIIGIDLADSLLDVANKYVEGEGWEKDSENWSYWLVKLPAWLNKPFGVHLELAKPHSWESICAYLNEVKNKGLFGRTISA